jgi:replication-associated recombination protein RarA
MTKWFWGCSGPSPPKKDLGKPSFEKEALAAYIAKLAGGDMRFALNMVEEAAVQFNDDKTITLEQVKSIERVPNYAMDKDEEEHYDSVSALQKSIRGSRCRCRPLLFSQALHRRRPRFDQKTAS